MHQQREAGTILVFTPSTGTETLTERIREILKRALQYSTRNLIESQASVEKIFDLCSKNNARIAILTHDWLVQESNKKRDLVSTITDIATSNTNVIVALKRNIQTVGSLSAEERRLVYVLDELSKIKASTKSSSERVVFENNINVFTEHNQAISHLTQLFDKKVSAN